MPVVDADGVLVGMLSMDTARGANEHANQVGNVLLAADLMRPADDRVTPDDSLLTALERFGLEDVETVPVVKSPADGHLLGTLRRQDVLATYARSLSRET